MKSIIKLELRNKVGQVEDECFLYHQEYFSESELTSKVQKYKNEYKKNLKGRHYKWENYEYAKNSLIEKENFVEILSFSF